MPSLGESVDVDVFVERCGVDYKRDEDLTVHAEVSKWVEYRDVRKTVWIGGYEGRKSGGGRFGRLILM